MLPKLSCLGWASSVLVLLHGRCRRYGQHDLTPGSLSCPTASRLLRRTFDERIERLGSPNLLIRSSDILKSYYSTQTEEKPVRSGSDGGVQVLNIQEEKATQAAIAVAVGAGSMFEPKDCPWQPDLGLSYFFGPWRLLSAGAARFGPLLRAHALPWHEPWL